MLYKNGEALSIKQLATEVFENTDYQSFQTFLNEVRNEGTLAIGDDKFSWEDPRGFSHEEDFTVEA